MKKIEIELKDLLGLLVGTVEERMNCLSNEKVFSSLELEDIKQIYQKELYRLASKGEYEGEFIFMLQTLAYNRHKSKFSDEIATFVFDKIFELMANDTDFVNGAYSKINLRK